MFLDRKKKVMMVWIGVDIAKRTVDICAHDKGAKSRTFRQPEQLAEAVEFILQHKDAHVVMEATGRYERPLFEALSRRGVSCSIVNAAHAYAFRKSLGKHAKTDAIDAQLLAWMGHALTPEPTAMPSRERQQLEGLVLRRAQLRKLETAEINHAEHGGSREVSRSHARMIKVLKAEIQRLDTDIAKATAKNTELSESSRRLQSVPGVGPVVAAGLLVHLPELGTASKGQVAALAGLAPFNVDSGTQRGQRAIRAGRSPIRALLYMAALVASKHNPVLRAVYRRLLAQGKPKKLALIAVARKLLIILNALMKHRCDWVCPASLEMAA